VRTALSFWNARSSAGGVSWRSYRKNE